MSNYKLYSASYPNFETKIRSNTYIGNYSDIKKVIHVTISFLGKIELKEFVNIEEGLSYNINRGLVYKFLEIEEPDRNPYSVYVVEQDYSERKVYFSHGLYGIGKHWNLFLNNSTKITAQGIGNMSNSYFSVSNDSRRYLYLSVLIYTLTNLETTDLEAEFEENKKII